MDMKNYLVEIARHTTDKHKAKNRWPSHAVQLFAPGNNEERDFEKESRRSRKSRFTKSNAPL
jgi:hypothetical protein